MVKHFLLLKSSIKWFKNLDIEFKLLALFFLIAHGGSILILDAIFWDDWILYRSSSTDLFDIFKQTGSPFNFAGYLHFILLEAGPWIYKILTFILMFFSGILLNKILIRYENIDKNRATVISFSYNDRLCEFYEIIGTQRDYLGVRLMPVS